MSKLSIKQEKFCQLYAATGNATQSFIDAGYAVKSKGAAAVRAYDLLNKNSNVQEKLRELAQKAEDKAICNIKEMQSVLSQIIREELDEEKLMTIGAGEGFSEVVSKRQKAALKDRLKAIELLGKMQGAFTEKHEINGNVGVTFVDDLEE